MASTVARISHFLGLELVAGQCGDEGQAVDGDDQAHGRNAELGQAASRMPNSTLAPMMKPSGFQAQAPIFSPSSVSTTSASKMMNSAEHRQQDAQHQREVARAPCGRPRRWCSWWRPARRRCRTTVNISPAKKSFWLLILMRCPSGGSRAGRPLVYRARGTDR